MSNATFAKEVLTWHLDIGVDETISDAPVNRFELVEKTPVPVTAPETAPSAKRSAPPPTRPGKAPPGPSGEEAVKSAYELAEKSTTVEELRGALESFDGCALKNTATNLVFCNGDAHARLMFVGEAPGAEEDRQGEPFIGPSGVLLDKMLNSIGIERSEVLISNTVFWRPPGNRTPTPQETAVCMPFVERLIELVDPDVLVTLGGPASKALLGETQGVGRLRGRWFTYETARMSHPIDATAMFHPAYLLRTPSQKRAAWSDLLGIQDKLSD
jgi:uracil-DNA glycosylase family 4